jgi:hypothetical protein
VLWRPGGWLKKRSNIEDGVGCVGRGERHHRISPAPGIVSAVVNA